MQLATAIHSHGEKSSFMGSKKLWTTALLGQKGDICHHNAMGLLHIVQTLEKEKTSEESLIGGSFLGNMFHSPSRLPL